jgi:hypothetical protein
MLTCAELLTFLPLKQKDFLAKCIARRLVEIDRFFGIGVVFLCQG